MAVAPGVRTVDPDAQGGVVLRSPSRGDVQLRAIPRHGLRALRGDRRELDEDLWALLTSGRVDAELDRQALVSRTTHPFADGVVFEPGADLGPFYRWADFEQHESVSVLDETSYVDPRGWVIRPPFQLVGKGLLFRHFGVRRPSFGQYCRTRLGRRAAAHPPLLSLRDPTERNYYHFMCDILGGRLRMADAAGVGRDRALLVSKAMSTHRNFRSLLRLTDLGDRDVIVQRAGEFVRTPQQTIVETPRFSRDNLLHLQRWLSVPEGDRQADRRLFVVREAATGRNIANTDAVADLARRYGFELVSTEDLSLEEQIELFSQARHVVGIWGSALFNVVWRRNAPLSLLEITPPLTRRPDAYWFYLARALGFRHYYFTHASLDDPYEQPTTVAAMRALKRAKTQPFEVDVDRLGTLVGKMLEEGGAG